MYGIATDSDADIFVESDLEAVMLVDAGLPEIYQQQVVTNELLGLILALIIFAIIFGLGNWLWRLIRSNIFKHL